MRTHFLFATLTGVAFAIPANNTCLPAGATDSQGRFSCNPAHQYPNGQTCDLFGGCYYLWPNGKPVSNTSSSAKPTQTPTCPAPGTTDSKGRYSCNPAHQYPSGQACVAADGCYYLCGANGKPVSNTAAAVTKPTQTATCPAPGSTDNKGRYSCNPAHQYPNSQTCVIVEGCYYLSTNGQTIKTTPTTQPIKTAPSGNPVTHTRTGQPVVTAGAAHSKGAGMLILVAVGLAL